MPAIRNVKDAITKFASSSAVEQTYKSATSLSDQHTYAKSTSPSKKRAKHPPTRPRNAFFIFRSEYNKACKQSCTNQAVVSKNAAEAWNALSEDAKAEWYELQEEAKKKHAEQYPEYAKRVRGVKKRETSSHESDHSQESPEQSPTSSTTLPNTSRVYSSIDPSYLFAHPMLGPFAEATTFAYGATALPTLLSQVRFGSPQGGSSFREVSYYVDNVTSNAMMRPTELDQVPFAVMPESPLSADVWGLSASSPDHILMNPSDPSTDINGLPWDDFLHLDAL